MLVRHTENQPMHPPKQSWRSVGEAWRALFDDRRFMLIAIAGALNNFAIAVLFVVYALYLLRTLEVEVLMLGVIVGTGTVGAIAASAMAGKLSQMWGIGRVLIVASIIKAAGVAVLASAGSGQAGTVLVLIAGFAAMFFGLQVFNINVVSLRQLTYPIEVLGRVSAANKFVVWVPFVIGSLLGGLLGEVSLRFAVAFAAGTLVVSVLPLCANVLRSLNSVGHQEAV
jgi:MFS family permease